MNTSVPETTQSIPPRTSDETTFILGFLAKHDAPCPVCAYNLRAITRPICPECSAPLHLSVGSENLAIGPWFLAILGPAFAVGFDAVLAVLLCLARILHPPRSPAERIQAIELIASFSILSALCALGIWFLLRRKRQWHLRPRRSQWIAAWIIFLGVGIGHCAFGWYLAMRVL